MLQFGLGGIIQRLQLKVQFMNSIIGWVFGISMWDTLIFYVRLFNCFHDSFENACRNLARMSLLTCQLITCLKHSTIFGCNNLGKMLNAFSLWFSMIMLGHSNKVHLIRYTWMVEDVKGVVLKMNWDYGEQANLVTRCKWPTPLLNTPMGPPSLLGYLIWKVKKFLDLQNGRFT